eukprot:CAMPEP_0118711322 /NCGR_PEP_ID=MMETSP0800-20121206/24006_1 /TAXON_ID=210618 ORGANISM="Striatella unipunctata, Strain CCMP2910" /NCGR_SAMPLE_ID=MMETSP0800 /ASSEMBLY_ACC=CAM_ASM_000638 /LENGTH=250 /DNA_ID=CAMNT_0006615869 /DNA_START=16 /DNA_END=764 /DNA_ORIENTATION=+
MSEETGRERERSRSPEGGGDADDRGKSNGYHDDKGQNDGPQGSDDKRGDAVNGDDDGVKLYIGNLDYATDEKRLREEFGAFGVVKEVFLPSDRNTGRPRGFGFVTLSTQEAAEKAIAKMDQAQLDGRTIRVNESKPRGPATGRGPGGIGNFNSTGASEVKLYVGNLAFETTEEAVRRLFEQHGSVTDCFMPTDRETGKVRGFAFVTMPSEDAERACIELNGQELEGRTIRVNEAQPKGSGGGGGGGGGGG